MKMETARLKRFVSLLDKIAVHCRCWAILYGFAICSWLASGGVAFAKRGKPAIDPSSLDHKQSDWVFGYTVVILMTAFGLLMVCRPARRANEPKVNILDQD